MAFVRETSGPPPDWFPSMLAYARYPRQLVTPPPFFTAAAAQFPPRQRRVWVTFFPAAGLSEEKAE